MHRVDQEESQERWTGFRDVAIVGCIAGLIPTGYEATVCRQMGCIREPGYLPYLGIDRHGKRCSKGGQGIGKKINRRGSHQIRVKQTSFMTPYASCLDFVATVLQTEGIFAPVIMLCILRHCNNLSLTSIFKRDQKIIKQQDHF